jgi:hypothetical protein
VRHDDDAPRIGTGVMSDRGDAMARQLNKAKLL